MNRNEAAAALARSLQEAGFARNPNPKARSPWIGPDGYPATRQDLRSHLIQAYHGDDRVPFMCFLRPSAGAHWPLVDQAASELIPARP